MRDLYPGYDVLAKRNTPSWNEKTRDVIEARLAIQADAHRFFDGAEWQTLQALAARVIPQPDDRRIAVPVAAMVDKKMCENAIDGCRDASMPSMREAWRRGLAAIDEEARTVHGRQFHQLGASEQDVLLARIHAGVVQHEAWANLPPQKFFALRLLPDLVKSYYSHPTAWNEIGWGGPASPRGYVRLEPNRRDSWEAAEAQPGREAEALRENRRVGR